jgi:hypothetical protein
MSKEHTPKKPSTIDPLALEVLEKLRAHPNEAQNIVLGGYFALKHYIDYRSTADIDGWWKREITPGEREATIERLRSIVAEVAEHNGLTFKERHRSTSEVLSFDFSQDNRPRFSIQVAPRSIEIAQPLTDRSPWAPIPIETFEDNIASKMNALVERGAPRDFQDIRAVVMSKLLSIDDAWALWQAKNPTLTTTEGKIQVLKHIESIECRRPIEAVPEGERQQVKAARNWIRDAFTREPGDRKNASDESLFDSQDQALKQIGPEEKSKLKIEL